MRRVPALTASALCGLLTLCALVGQTGAAAARGETSAVTAAVGSTWPAMHWSLPTGPIAESSPTIASYDGVTFAAVGSENGELYLINVTTGHEMPGWPQRLAAPPGVAAAIESSPAIASLSTPSGPPSIIVGTGSTWLHNTVGEVEAFALSGKSEWVFHVGTEPGTAIGVISSPAVGDVTGTGQQDVVFGSWDHRIYALTPAGKLVAGFPFDNTDTIWSSPALYKLPGQHEDDIFLGSDAHGLDGCHGGWIGDYRLVKGALHTVWRDCERQTIWSSPAVVSFGGRILLAVGTGFFYQPFPPVTDELLVLNALNGIPIAGFPAPTAGPVLGSPAIGLVRPGVEAIVDTSWDCTGRLPADCAAPKGPPSSRVYAWTLSGRLIWSDTLPGGATFSSPVLVPLRGEVTNDVLVGTVNALYPLNGSTGALLDGTTSAVAINTGCEMLNSVAVAPVGAGWSLVEACGGPNRPSRVVDYLLPQVPPPGVSAAWPMFRANPNHTGT